MKVIGICGSPRKVGSTTLKGLKTAMTEVEANGLETEIIELSKYTFSGCTGCNACKKTGKCAIKDDFSEIIYPKLLDQSVGGFIFASPVYFGGMTSQLKAFFDRAVMIRRQGFGWEDKVAGALSIGHSRNGGQELAAMDILACALIHGMTVVSDSSPTSHFGANLYAGVEGGVEADETGLATATNLGRKVGRTVKKLFA